MSDYDDGAAYSRGGGKLYGTENVSSSFRAGVQSNEAWQELLSRPAPNVQTPVYSGGGGGATLGLGGIVFVAGLLLLFLSPKFGMILMIAGVAIAILRFFLSLLSSKTFWVFAAFIGILVYRHYHPFH